MKTIEWFPTHIETARSTKNKKVTGTRFATILGLSPWSTAFEQWCAITKLYEIPFEDTQYTLAGKAIEPKQAEYLKNAYGLTLISPTERFGENYFQKTWGDFFKDIEIFGGMWDFLGVNDEGVVDTVYEMKTTKRAEDWGDDIPEYYALQAALYAYLLGVDHVVMVASFLEDEDYSNPENFTPNVSNTITVEFNVSERYPNFEEYLNVVREWWDNHVLSGVSPEFDEQQDAKILKVLRTNSVIPDVSIDDILKEAETLKKDIDKVTDSVAKDVKRLKELTDLLKKYAIENFRKGDKKVELQGKQYIWTVSKSQTESVDKKALEADGLLPKYTTKSDSYRLTVASKGE